MCPCCFDWVTTCTVKAASNVRCGAMRVRTLSGRFDSDRVHPWQCAGDLVFTESFETFSQVNLSESFRCMVWSANHSKLKVLEKGGIMPKNPDIPPESFFWNHHKHPKTFIIKLSIKIPHPQLFTDFTLKSAVSSQKKSPYSKFLICKIWW